MNYNDHARDLWKQVFVAAIRAGSSYYDAESKADYAVKRFAEKEFNQ